MGNEKDSTEYETVIISNKLQSKISRMRIFGGFVSLGLITAIFLGGLNYGQYVNSVDTNVKNIAELEGKTEKALDDVNRRIEKVLQHLKKSDDIQTKMIASIDARDEFYMRVLEQQGRSDEDFLKVIKSIEKGVHDNTKNIFVLENILKTSRLSAIPSDNLAMR